MSDHWETYPCMMGAHVAWVAYDHGVSDALRDLPYPHCARFRVPLQSPDEQGLPQSDEFARLSTIEDALSERVAAAGGVLVGRITTDGARYLVFYTFADAARSRAIAHEVAQSTGYQVEPVHDADPGRTHYWHELFPTPDDWQVMQDIRVERSLREHGDPLTTPRAIQHWTYFRTAADRDRFIAAVGGSFDVVRPLEAVQSPDQPFGATLLHAGLPDHASMNPITIRLAREARACDGQYDGWETQVCTP